jgi:hypothetical protein
MAIGAVPTIAAAPRKKPRRPTESFLDAIGKILPFGPEWQVWAIPS